MAADSSPSTYRVIGVRTDKTRVDLGKGLTMDRARAVLKALSGTNAFAELLIEPESERPCSD